jgi:hypothetical protein
VPVDLDDLDPGAVHRQHRRLARAVTRALAQALPVASAGRELETAYRVGWPKLPTITVGALKSAGCIGPCPCGRGGMTTDCVGVL